jgi:hypothetical protein
VSSSTATLPARSAQRARAGLALICGLLGLPGSTIAWDLPKGGYWIGMPLAAAAIALGVQAFPRVTGRQRGMAVAAIVLGVVEVLFTATWTVLA